MVDVYLFDVVCMLIGCYSGVLVGVCFDDFVVYVLKLFVECSFDFDFV